MATSKLLRTLISSRHSLFGPRSIRALTLVRVYSSTSKEERYWSKIPSWSQTSAEEFISHRFQVRYSVNTVPKLEKFLTEVLPDHIAQSQRLCHQHIRTRKDFIQDVTEGLKLAPMALKLTPHILSRINWRSPLDDPIRRQFLPLKSGILPDHPELTLDSLHEEEDSVVPGLVHRYPGRALFLTTSICPVYCRFCTRAYSVGANTELVTKFPQKPSLTRWEKVFEYIQNHESIQDIVISGGDSYQLTSDQIQMMGKRLLDIPHVRRFRIATRGLAFAPGRILDPTDSWSNAVIAVSQRGRKMGKQVCIHTHFDHPDEITWITRKAANKLFEAGVIVRNQSVLLKGVNDDNETMGKLIKELADINIQPYYVYQGDLTRGIEDLRTPLRKILDMDRFIRGTFSGFMMPSFVVDLPGGGGKRLASTYESYDEENGVSYWTAPGLPGKKGRQVYTYYDPYPASLSAEEAKHRHEHTKRMVELETARIQRNIVARRADHEENGVSADAVVQRAFSRPVGSYGSNLPVDYAILRPNEPLCANK